MGPALIGLASAAIDVSDGLLADLGHVCDVSGCGATVRQAAVPLSPALTRCRGFDRMAAMAAGDDYELLFTAPPAAVAAVMATAARLGVPVAEIGTVEPEPGVRVVDADGNPVAVARTGYRHF